MRQAHLRATPRRARDRSRLYDAGGFTVVELVVVLVIVAVLMAIAVPTYMNAKRSMALKSTVATAQSYKEAIAAFTLDHQGRVPVWNSVADWPAPLETGPKYPADFSAPGTAMRPYMRGGVPEAVQNRQVAITDNLNTATAGSLRGAIVYSSPSSAAFELQVYVRSSSRKPWTLQCRLGTTEESSSSC